HDTTPVCVQIAACRRRWTGRRRNRDPRRQASPKLCVMNGNGWVRLANLLIAMTVVLLVQLARGESWNRDGLRAAPGFPGGRRNRGYPAKGEFLAFETAVAAAHGELAAYRWSLCIYPATLVDAIEGRAPSVCSVGHGAHSPWAK